MSERNVPAVVCGLDCRSFRDWSSQHFHLGGGLTVFQTPEKRVGTVTFHEAWGVDSGGSTCHADTKERAFDIARKVYGWKS